MKLTFYNCLSSSEFTYFIQHILNLPISSSYTRKVLSDMDLESEKPGYYQYQKVLRWYNSDRKNYYTKGGYLERYLRGIKQESSNFLFDEKYLDKYFNDRLRDSIKIQCPSHKNTKLFLFCHICKIEFSKCIEYFHHIKYSH